VEPHEPAPDADQPEPLHEEAHFPAPTLWPLGFAIGIVVILVGLVINPLVISTIGAVIAIVFAALWAREATAELRGESVAVEPERRELGRAAEGETAQQGAAMPAPAAGEESFPRSHFLEGATLGLGALIGGLVTIPVVGFAVAPSFLGQKRHRVDLGPISTFPEGEWYIATFVTEPAEADVSNRTAFIRNNGVYQNEPSFTIISNRCAHLGCPVQANGPTGPILGKKTIREHTANGPVTFVPVVPAGFGCPCHGGQYDTEGNRTAGPPVRALDRWSFEINHGRLILLSLYSVSHVDGSGAQALIHKYKLAGPGEHVDGPEQWFYPFQPPHN
jgi:quinol---cytochrome c reductase iron-sulfur subunit, bacillus type